MIGVFGIIFSFCSLIFFIGDEIIYALIFGILSLSCCIFKKIELNKEVEK